MVRVFADTGYWIALVDPRDPLRLQAVRAFRTYKMNQIVTTEMVLTELLNSVSDAGQHRRQAVSTTIVALRNLSQITIHPQTSELFDRAFDLYQRRSDKSWSLTDCASFIIVKEQQLTSALTHDQHFVQAGFEALLR